MIRLRSYSDSQRLYLSTTTRMQATKIAFLAASKTLETTPYESLGLKGSTNPFWLRKARLVVESPLWLQ